jgi:hypothetical protein
MTVFGKLLVFLNLVFAVVTGALIVFVFTTRANWQTAYNDAKAKAEQAEAAYRAEKASHENDLKSKSSEVDSMTAEVRRLKDDVVKVQEDNERLQKAAQAQLNLTNKATANEKASEEELKQIRSERQALVDEKKVLQDRIVKMQQEIDSWRNIAVNADLQAKNLLQKNSNLLRSVEDLNVKVRELEASGALVGVGAGSGGSGVSIVDPPPRSAPANVRGKVIAVGKTGTSLAQINIGSDSGLSPGNSLTVYLGTEYKGDLLLTTVEAKSAVGKFIPAKRTSKIAEGDNVITSFSGVPQ